MCKRAHSRAVRLHSSMQGIRGCGDSVAHRVILSELNDVATHKLKNVSNRMKGYVTTLLTGLALGLPRPPGLDI